MKVLPFKIPKTAESSIRVQVDHQPYFYDTLHQHPEIQITLIKSGSGTLFQGDYIGQFKPGDVFWIGANVPHVLRCDASFYEQDSLYKAHAVSVFFDRNSLGDGFFDLPEMRQVSELIDQSQPGLRLTGELKKDIGQRIDRMTTIEGVNIIIHLLDILKCIQNLERFEYLSSGIHQFEVEEKVGQRLNDIYQFTLSEFNRPITLEEVANLANMTPAAFCRFFKKRTRKTYISFLNEIRIAHACKLLINSESAIIQVGFDAGFSNLSNFNRQFKAIMNLTPNKYKNNYEIATK